MKAPSTEAKLMAVIDNLLLRTCKRCGHLHLPGHICYECRYDSSVPEEDEPTF